MSKGNLEVPRYSGIGMFSGLLKWKKLLHSLFIYFQEKIQNSLWGHGSTSRPSGRGDQQGRTEAGGEGPR